MTTLIRGDGQIIPNCPSCQRSCEVRDNVLGECMLFSTQVRVRAKIVQLYALTLKKGAVHFSMYRAMRYKREWVIDNIERIHVRFRDAIGKRPPRVIGEDRERVFDIFVSKLQDQIDHLNSLIQQVETFRET